MSVVHKSSRLVRFKFGLSLIRRPSVAAVKVGSTPLHACHRATLQVWSDHISRRAATPSKGVWRIDQLYERLYDDSICFHASLDGEHVMCNNGNATQQY
jgi:hypothetical protein